MPYSPPKDLPLLRKRYKPEQIYLYFHPYPDRSPEIRRLKQLLGELYKKIWGLAIAGLILVVLLIGSALQGVTYLGLLEFVCIIGIVVLIIRLVRPELFQLREKLRQEIAADAREKEITRSVQPPNELQYDEWISAISNDIHSKAPDRLYLPKNPEKFRASLCLEGRMESSDEAEEKPGQLEKSTTHNKSRRRHYSIYEFTALFITENYVAIYTSVVNLRDSTQDREEFEYCYHQHLSHMLLKVNTMRNVDTQLQSQIFFSLSLTFDSGRTIRRNISAIHVGDESTSEIAKIHEKLTWALIDHEMSVIGSIREGKKLAEEGAA